MKILKMRDEILNVLVLPYGITSLLDKFSVIVQGHGSD